MIGSRQLQRAALLMISMIFSVACASQSSGVFANDGILSREMIQLDADGTFSYCFWSDDGGATLYGRGTWRWLDRAHSQLETVVTAREMERGHVLAVDDLPDVVVWTARRNALQRRDRSPLRRSAVRALSPTGCMLTN